MAVANMKPREGVEGPNWTYVLVEVLDKRGQTGSISEEDEFGREESQEKETEESKCQEVNIW